MGTSSWIRSPSKQLNRQAVMPPMPGGSAVSDDPGRSDERGVIFARSKY